MAEDEVLDYDVLPCGCTTSRVVKDGQKLFVMAPCRMDCENYLYAVAEAGRQGKPVEKRTSL